MKLDDAVEEIKRISHSKSCRFTYFFNLTSIEELLLIADKLIGEISFVDVSKYCNDDDSWPDIITLINDLKNRNRSTLLRGLDRYLLHRKMEDKEKIYRQLQSISSDKGALIVLSYNSDEIIKKVILSDIRNKERVFWVDGVNQNDNFKLMLISSNLPQITGSFNGIKDYLETLEKEEPKRIYYLQTKHVHGVSSDSISISVINSFHDLVVQTSDSGVLYLDEPADYIWEEYYVESKTSLLNDIYHKHFRNEAIAEIIERLSKPYDYWLFISYQMNYSNPNTNPYLHYVIEKTKSIEDFHYFLVFGLLDIDYHDVNYQRMYDERKKYLLSRPVKSLNDYCSKVISQKVIPDSLFYLTDNTDLEKDTILDIIVKHEKIDDAILEALKNSYVDLYDYLKQFSELPESIRDYFEQYRTIKVLNKKPPESFLQLVRDNIFSSKYVQFDHRDVKFNEVVNERSSIVFIDAMGIEYLPFIKSLCEEYDLDVKSFICRSNLPTITLTNISVLKGKKYDSIKQLDILAHKNNEDDYCSSSRYIKDQLKIIRDMIRKIHDTIKGAEEVVVFSDHGCSRLFVLNGQEEGYDWKVGTEHNGRCALIQDTDYSEPNIKCESGYYIAADYSRMRFNMPKAKIEAHGGATLEEVLVPILLITNPGQRYKECEYSAEVTLDPIKGMAIFVIYYPTDTESLSIIMNGVRYYPTKKDNNYSFELTGVSIGTFELQIYDGYHLLKNDTLKISGKGLKKKSNLFDQLR